MAVRVRQERIPTSARYLLERRGGSEKGTWMVERLVFTRTIKNEGLRKVHAHDLRHTLASLFILKGTKPKYVQEQLEHANIKTPWIS